jgi:hypothetical protein
MTVKYLQGFGSPPVVHHVRVLQSTDCRGFWDYFVTTKYGREIRSMVIQGNKECGNTGK